MGHLDSSPDTASIWPPGSWLGGGGAVLRSDMVVAYMGLWFVSRTFGASAHSQCSCALSCHIVHRLPPPSDKLIHRHLKGLAEANHGPPECCIYL